MSNDKEKNTYIKRFLDNNYSKEDAIDFFHSIINDEDCDEIKKYSFELFEKKVEEGFRDEDNKFQSTLLADKLIRKITLKEKRCRYILHTFSVAASIALVFGILYGSYKYADTSNVQQIVFCEVATSIGETRVITLPDGSTVELNSCSVLSYPEQFTGDKRLVKLTGEGYFRVYRNEQQPFIVQTEHFKVKVLGTEFDVKAYPSDEILSVNVTTGKVQVEMPGATLKLSSDEKMTIHPLVNSYSKEQDDCPTAIWRSGRLQYDRTPVREVAKELERIYGYKINFASGQVFDGAITGEHNNKSLKAVLKSIAFTSGIRYAIDEEMKEVLLYKQ